MKPSLSLVFLAAAILSTTGCIRPGELSLEERAARLHHDAIVIDGHSDTTPFFQDPTWNFGERHPASETHMDLPRMREGGLDAQFWSIYMGKKEGVPWTRVRLVGPTGAAELANELNSAAAAAA